MQIFSENCNISSESHVYNTHTTYNDVTASISILRINYILSALNQQPHAAAAAAAGAAASTITSKLQTF